MNRLAFALTLMMIVIAANDVLTASPATFHAGALKPVFKRFSGVVEAVTLADLEHEIRSEIVATNGEGRRSSFLITATTTIYDQAWKLLTLMQILRGDRVKIRYVTTAEGLNVSRSIHLIGRSPFISRPMAPRDS